jgi:hypothetical protein
MRLSSLWAQEPTASPSLYRGKRRPRKLGSRNADAISRSAQVETPTKKEPETTTTLPTTKSNLLGSVGGGGG